ncbi:PREDICTED: centromere protein I-like [Trachymyrmex cornetzi]|uniref:centromere protein I-like n=1 Tax=Trachymyrmex cornetzi TaxID=471704 RepID=UPI00084EF5CD|nr:PREDICTED: centromere protein I-like [Trachymyrmex cornetzi]
MGLGKITYNFLLILFSSSHNPGDLVQFCVIFVSNFSRMEENETRATCLKHIKALKSKDANFDVCLPILQDEASRGLDDDILKQLLNVIIHTDLGAMKRTSLIKCLIPRYKLSEETVKTMITWCLSSINDLPFTVGVISIQWIIGVWDCELVDRKVINIYYDVFFYIMLKKPKLACHIARLVYVLTKPEDVSRRDVIRLLKLQKSYSKSPTHIIALLSLFKSYKPELVPEKIESVNIESVWKPIPEVIRLALEDARDRAEIQQSCQSIQPFSKWNVMQNLKVKKKTKALLPSVGYFHIGSSIFKDKDAKSIFDINSVEELGKYHQIVELPCNAVSLLGNTIGYHLLTYANFQYQSRFSYNLYNTLIRAFILENGKFSKEEMDKFLTMTIEFSRYMQEGIPVVKLFFDEYLYYNSGEHLPRLLDLLQWMTSISVTELRENILIHVQNIFYESSLNMKCEIIRSLQKLITNLFVRQGFEEQDQYASPFLQQGRLDDLAEIVPVITTILENLIVCGLNIHNYNVILLSECLAFYEEICTLESRSHVLSWTLPPPAVIYGAFITKSCAILSRICKLLLRYREITPHLRQIMPSDIYEEKIHIISLYASDIYKALWYDEPFSENGNLLKNLSKKVRSDLRDCDLETLLNISNHYAILAYRYTLSKKGLQINTKEEAESMAFYYIPAVNEFLAAFKE